MPEGQRHLTHPERCQIHALMKSGLSSPAIARQPGCDRTTVWREVRRNPGKRACRHAQAQRLAEGRRSAAPSVPSRMTPEPVALVEGRLVRGWSPARVAGRLRKEGHPVAGRQWTCRHVHADRRAGGRLWRHLRCRGKRPNRRGGAHAGRGHIPGRVDISERPALVEAKERTGDWEADTIVGAGHNRIRGSVRQRDRPVLPPEPPASRWMPGPGTGPSRARERETMTAAGAGMDVRGKTPDIHPTGGTGPPPATPTACAGPPASRGGWRGAGRHGGHGADAPGPPAVPARPGLPGRHRQPAPVPGPPPARRRAGEDRQGRRGGARGPRRRVPGHGARGAGGRDRRQAPRHAGASGGPRRPAHRAEAVPAGVGEPEPEGPVTGVLEEPAAAVSGYDRRTGEPVRDPEGLL